MATGKFTVNEVEERTKVPASTLRQWERRYGFPKPERSDAGYRLYSELDLGHIDAMKRHISEGIPASRAAQLVRASSPVTDLAEPVPSLRTRVADALAAFDEERAERLLSEAHSLHPVDTVVESVLVGAETELQRRLEDGQVEAAVISSARSFLHGRLRGLLALTPNSPQGRLVFVAGAPGEDSELPLLAITLFLRRAGERAIYLGPDVAAAELVSLSERRRPAAVVVHAGDRRSLAGLAANWRRLRQFVPTLAIAGTAAVPAGSMSEAPLEHLGTGLAESVKRLHVLLPAASHAPLGGP